MHAQAEARPSGSLGLAVIRKWPHRAATVRDVLAHGVPRRGLAPGVASWRLRNARNLWRGLWRTTLARAVARVTHCPVMYGQLWLRVYHADGSVTPLGLASMRVVTTAGVNFLVDALQGTVEPELLKFHGIGTGGTAEAVGDTALVTESTTALNPDSTRATGSLGEGASANIFRTVGTVLVDASVAATEHGIFSQAATGGGTLLDRTLFTVVNLASGDSLQATYDLTITAGG